MDCKITNKIRKAVTFKQFSKERIGIGRNEHIIHNKQHGTKKNYEDTVYHEFTVYFKFILSFKQQWNEKNYVDNSNKRNNGTKHKQEEKPVLSTPLKVNME